MSKKQIVILGGGTGGTMTANRLRRRFDSDEAEVHVVDRDDRHVYQPGLLFVPFGLAHVDEIVRPRRRQLRNGVVFHQNEVAEVSTERDEVLLDDGAVLPYDALVVATGVRLQPEETEGMTGAGWNENVFTFYDAEGAEALRRALERFDGGRLLVNLVDMPIKCPVATVGNPGLHMATWVGAFPGMSWLATKLMARQMEKIDIPPIPEFLELIGDSGANLYACKATVDMFGLTMDDFVPQVEEIISVGEFYEKAAGGQIIFT